jgi:tripartite-type tricarboxylate transporter receptor subunit TctC
VISRLNGALRSAVSDPAVVQPLETQGLTAAPTSPGEFAQLIRADYEKWMKVFGRMLR